MMPRPGRLLALGYEGTSPPDGLFSFAARFGPLEVHPFIPSNTGQPELVRFENHLLPRGRREAHPPCQKLSGM